MKRVIMTQERVGFDSVTCHKGNGWEHGCPDFDGALQWLRV